MDKNTKINANIPLDHKIPVKVIPLPKGQQDIHRTFGLWICRTLQKVSYPPRNTIHPRVFKFYSLSHLIDGDGSYWNRKTNSIATVKKGQGIMISPDFVHFYSSTKNKYVEDAICFSGIIADNLYRSGIIRDGIIDIGKSRKLLPIMELASSPSRDSQIKANSALQSLLVELYFRNRDSNSVNRLSLIDELLEKIADSPENPWTVSEMAEFCNLSINHFRRLFRSHTGLNPKLYIDMVKINKASELLLSPDQYSISRVSDLLGYSDQYHFSRRFKAITGASPVNYIKNSLNTSRL